MGSESMKEPDIPQEHFPMDKLRKKNRAKIALLESNIKSELVHHIMCYVHHISIISSYTTDSQIAPFCRLGTKTVPNRQKGAIWLSVVYDDMMEI